MANKSAVFAVHKGETSSGRYHEVMWAKDGNLNAASRRGNVKRFRMWKDARAFALKKAKQLECTPMFS